MPCSQTESFMFIMVGEFWLFCLLRQLSIFYQYKSCSISKNSVNYIVKICAKGIHFYFTSRGDRMPKVNIVLLEPQIPQNTGNIARTCAATGARLHLIKPMGFEIDDKKLKRAGLDYWHLLDISYYENIEDFFAKNSGNYYFFTTKAEKTYCDINYPDETYLFFGREDAGLPEKLLMKNRNTCLRIPMIPNARSLNLSNAVAIACYEVLRQLDFPKLENQGKLTSYSWNDEISFIP